MLIDTHCHLNDTEAFPDPAEAIREALGAGVERLVVIGVDDDSSLLAVKLAEGFESVYATVGWHPNYTAKYQGLKVIQPLLEHPKVVGLGEMGLDFHWDYATRDQQDRALHEQLELGLAKVAPMVFHCREAYPEVLDVLEQHGPGPYILHCFAGDTKDAERAMALDCYFGVDGPITYKKADDLRAVVAGLPLDRILIETDSPWLSPVPFRGRRNRPAYVVWVNEVLASLFGKTPAEMGAITTANAKRIFSKLA